MNVTESYLEDVKESYADILNGAEIDTKKVYILLLFLWNFFDFIIDFVLYMIIETLKPY